MNETYLWVKWVHVLSATLLFGTGLGTAFHMYMTHRRGNVVAIAATLRNTTLADWLFIATSGIIQPVSGLLLAQLAGYNHTDSWLVLTYVLYAITAACWIKVVALQYRLRALAETAAATGSTLPPAYFAAMRLWCFLGWPAFVSLVIIFALMVIRPVLW